MRVSLGVTKAQRPGYGSQRGTGDGMVQRGLKREPFTHSSCLPLPNRRPRIAHHPESGICRLASSDSFAQSSLSSLAKPLSAASRLPSEKRVFHIERVKRERMRERVKFREFGAALNTVLFFLSPLSQAISFRQLLRHRHSSACIGLSEYLVRLKQARECVRLRECQW